MASVFFGLLFIIPRFEGGAIFYLFLFFSSQMLWLEVIYSIQCTGRGACPAATHLPPPSRYSLSVGVYCVTCQPMSILISAMKFSRSCELDLGAWGWVGETDTTVEPRRCRHNSLTLLKVKVALKVTNWKAKVQRLTKMERFLFSGPWNNTWVARHAHFSFFKPPRVS